LVEFWGDRAMRTDQHSTATYLVNLTKELAIIADKDNLTTLAHLFRMAELEADAIRTPAVQAKFE
jgi:hypothetical protein